MKDLKGRDLEKGDVIFIDGRSKWNIIGRAIRVVQTGGKHPDHTFNPNHIGIVIEENDNLHEVKVIQSAFLGVRIRKLGGWTKHPTCNITVKRYNRTLTDIQKRVMMSWLKSQIGRWYDYPALLGIILRYILLKAIEHPVIKYFFKRLVRNPFDGKLRFICSELVYYAFLYGTHESIWTETTPGFITPYDEFRSKKFTTIGRYWNYQYN
jgi:hypothetical protein